MSMPGHHEERILRGGTPSLDAAHADGLSRDLREALCRVLRESRHRPLDVWRMRAALREACERARREDVRVERVLVALKQAWRESPECAQVPRQDANELRGQIVAACIDEYYEVAAGRRRGDSEVRRIS